MDSVIGRTMGFRFKNKNTTERVSRTTTHLRVGRIFQRDILYAQPETRKHSQYKTTGTRSLAGHTCCQCWTPSTHMYILCFRARSLINRPNGRRWARTPFPDARPSPLRLRASYIIHFLSQSLSSFNIPFPCIVPVLENICIFHSVLFYFVFISFFFFSERFVVGPKQNETRAAPLSERIKKGPGSSTIHYTLCVHFETFLHRRCCWCCCCCCCMCNVVDKQCIIINGSHGRYVYKQTALYIMSSLC